jgi:hypothetical protein
MISDGEQESAHHNPHYGGVGATCYYIHAKTYDEARAIAEQRHADQSMPIEEKPAIQVRPWRTIEDTRPTFFQMIRDFDEKHKGMQVYWGPSAARNQLAEDIAASHVHPPRRRSDE